MIPDFAQERHPRRASSAASRIRQTIGRSCRGNRQLGSRDPFGKLSHSVWPVTDDISWRIVVAHPDLSTPIGGDGAAHCSCRAPYDLRVVAADAGTGIAANMVSPRFVSPVADHLCWRRSSARNGVERFPRSGCWGDDRSYPWRSDGWPSLVPLGRVDPTRSAAVHPPWRGSRCARPALPGVSTLAIDFGQVGRTGHRLVDSAECMGRSCKEIARERHWRRSGSTGRTASKRHRPTISWSGMSSRSRSRGLSIWTADWLSTVPQ